MPWKRGAIKFRVLWNCTPSPAMLLLALVLCLLMISIGGEDNFVDSNRARLGHTGHEEKALI